MADHHDASTIADRLRQVLRPGQDIVVAQAFGFPGAIMAALRGHEDLLRGSRMFVGMAPGDFPIIEGVVYETLFPSGPFGTDEAMRATGVRYHRGSLYGLSCALRDGARPVDLVIATGTPPRGGRHSLGLGVDFIHPAAERATAVLLEIVEDLPWTGSASTIGADASVVPINAGGRAMTTTPTQTGDVRLAHNLLPLIPDGATLELGMGKWSEPLIKLLGETRRSLRLHTGSLSDWVLPLVQSGALDISGGLVATAAGGTRAFYEAMPALGIELAPAYITHDPDTLAELPCFRAINSVLEVDLLGRANSEFGANGRRGGLGGLPDYAGGAAANPDGVSILALSAVAGGVSRIVARLPDAHVSLDESKVDIIVTEFGVADLRGKGPRDRALQMLEVAAPTFRAAIEIEARSLDLI